MQEKDTTGPRPAAPAELLLRERVKELECLYEVSRVLRDADAGLEELLAALVRVIPRGLQYPALAEARIRLGTTVRQTDGFAETRFRLSAPVALPGSPGAVEVCYREEVADTDPQPFLPEEARLLEKIASEVALAAGSIRTAEQSARLETQLRHADRLATIGVLAAGIAHELNEPLSRILGFAQLVQKVPGLPDGTGRDIGRIVDASLHAREIVQKLLAFGRGAAARALDCDMDEITAGALDFLEPRCRAAGVEVRRELARRRILVHADPTELRQVIVNLAVNAVQAMPRGGRLTVRVEERDGSCLASVEDTGVGMTPEVLERIFIPFFTTKEGGRGTGLGLPVVHGIVTSLGGTISVKSAVGSGSRFTVLLPLSAGGESGEARE